MTEDTIAPSPVIIQTSSEVAPSTPPWFGEMTVIAQYLRHLGVLSAIEERVRFARRRFGHYDLIDFAVVLLGYAISGECTLETFYERLQPFAHAFMALFGRERLPHRSTLSRFLAVLDQGPVEALRTLFLEDLIARPASRRRRKREGCGTGKEGIGWCSMLMARDKPPANAPCPARLISHLPNADWTRSVLLAIQDASGERLFGPGRLCSSPTRINGSARFREHRAQATVTIEESCDKQ
jgi:hypothetical protein